MHRCSPIRLKEDPPKGTPLRVTSFLPSLLHTFSSFFIYLSFLNKNAPLRLSGEGRGRIDKEEGKQLDVTFKNLQFPEDT
jgi:hypothetical protein